MAKYGKKCLLHCQKMSTPLPKCTPTLAPKKFFFANIKIIIILMLRIFVWTCLHWLGVD